MVIAPALVHRLLVHVRDFGDAKKLAAYTAAVVLLSLWLAPVAYQGLKALVDVADGRVSHDSLRGFAAWAAGVEFHEVFVISLLAFAMLLLPPLHDATCGGVFRSIRLGHGDRNLRRGAIAFAAPAVAGGLALIVIVFFAGGWGGGVIGFATLIKALLAGAALALVFEAVFRGVLWSALANDFRQRWLVLALTALIFTVFRLLLVPMTGGFTFACDESWSLGWQMLAMWIRLLFDPAVFFFAVIPVFAWGILLGLVRQQSGGIWLPFSLHAGWLTIDRLHHSIPALPSPGAFVICGCALAAAWIIFAATHILRPPSQS